MKSYLSIFMWLFAMATYCQGQNYIDTLYNIQTDTDVVYGVTRDFAGNQRTLLMDISYPTNAPTLDCGRPMMVLVHGGAFLDGSKEDANIARMRKDFAKRGYTTAAVNYRLGMVQDDFYRNCNITFFGLEWNCFNQADTTEWYRAMYRGMQDVNGAIRFLANRKDTYSIDPENMFIVGESAGAYIAMAAGFIDDTLEVRTGAVGALPALNAPHSNYESECVQHYDLAPSIASMDLSRPDLGDYHGDLNDPLEWKTKILGVGAFYGGVFDSIFPTTDTVAPALYMFHQPNDLVVPIKYDRLFAGYAYCAVQTGCVYIANRPHTHGTRSMSKMINAQANASLTVPDFWADTTSNYAGCGDQVANPSLGGHQIDDYWLRTTNMATFFAGKLELDTICTLVGIEESFHQLPQLRVYPNPVHSTVSVRLDIPQVAGRLSILDLAGREIWHQNLQVTSGTTQVNLARTGIASGLWFVRYETVKGTSVCKLVVTQ